LIFGWQSRNQVDCKQRASRTGTREQKSVDNEARIATAERQRRRQRLVSRVGKKNG
jgi:hypothetical protein